MSPAAHPYRRPFDPERGKRIFTVIVVVLLAGYLGRTIRDEPQNWRAYLVIGGLLSAASIALAWLAVLAWTKIRIGPLRLLLALVLAWHAFFGPSMLLHRIITPVTTNHDLSHLLWPHVIRWINSFE